MARYYKRAQIEELRRRGLVRREGARDMLVADFRKLGGAPVYEEVRVLEDQESPTKTEEYT